MGIAILQEVLEILLSPSSSRPSVAFSTIEQKEHLCQSVLRPFSIYLLDKVNLTFGFGKVFSDLAQICQLSCPSRALMSVIFKGINEFAKKYQLELTGLLNVCKVTQNLGYVISHTVSSCLDKLCRSPTEIAPTNEDQLFLSESAHFIRFSLVVFFTVIKNHSSALKSCFDDLALFCLTLGRDLPKIVGNKPSPSLLEATRLQIAKCVSFLEASVVAILQILSSDLAIIWLSKFAIHPIGEEDDQEKDNLDTNCFILPKLGFLLRTLVTITPDHPFFLSLQESLQWIANAIPRTGFELFLIPDHKQSDDQPLPLFFRIYAAISSYLLTILYNHPALEVSRCLSFLLDLLFHPHFLCCRLSMETWYSNLPKESLNLLTISIDKTFILFISRQFLLRQSKSTNLASRIITELVSFSL